MRVLIITHVVLPNGAAHRLKYALEACGHDVAFCGLPLLGADLERSERYIAGSVSTSDIVTRARAVPWTRVVRNCIELRAFLRTLYAQGWESCTLIACDPLSYFLASTISHGSVTLSPRIVYFVDFSPQRLDRPLERQAYTRMSRWAIEHSDKCATISTMAKDAFVALAGGKAASEMYILPNLPIPVENDVPWETRPLRVISLGGLRLEHGAQLLGEIAERTRQIVQDNVAFDVVGHGPAFSSVAAQCEGLTHMRFHGPLERVESIRTLLASARVGLALYDPAFSQFRYGSPLKIRDYLTAGLKVVTTWPSASYDGAVFPVNFKPESIAAGLAEALMSGSPAPSLSHPLVTEGADALERLLAAIGA